MPMPRCGSAYYPHHQLNMSNNHDDELQQVDVFGLFSQSQETLDDAKKKSAAESGSQTQYLQINQDGTYSVRILPLAPVIGPDGNPLTMDRKGYEYPYRNLFLPIKGKDKKGKETVRKIPVCHTKFVFPTLENDLIDLYVRIACEQNSNDDKLCKKIKGNSYEGGLRYNSQRCMYVFNMDERSKGLQILQLSFSQYKDLEDAKLRLWGKLAKKDSNTPCPISSPMHAFPVEITRKTENKKTSYAINIDTINGVDELIAEELQMLLDAPRLPEALYVYRRFHLEATIEFLKQTDEQYGINVMKSQEIKDCIDQIKMALPSDDQSHFSFNNTNDGEEENDGAMTLEKLWAIYDEIEEAGKDDRSEEGQNLRTQLREFIEANDLDIRVDRKKSNLVVLEEIQDIMGNDSDDDEPDAPSNAPEDEDDDTDAPDTEPEDEDDSEDEPVSPRRTRNDDTNEPAARPGRRTSRPARRR